MFRKILVLSLVLVAGSAGMAQSSKEIHNLVFEGAGIRGIAYCGALKELESRGLMSQVQRVAGTSAGAIMAMAVSIGYSADELKQIISSTNFKEFNDGRYFFIGGINRMNKYFGWYRSKKFDQWIGKLIEAKTGDPNTRFADLVDGKYKDLYITGTCLNKQRLMVFSKETYPGMRVRDAVRISMSIPLYFEAVFLDSSGNIIYHPRDKDKLDIMVDGGFTGNFPIRIFDSTRYHSPSVENIFNFNKQTIGFRIDRDEQIKNDASGKALADLPVDNLRSYFGAFYNIVIENLNRQTLTIDDWTRTVSISDGGIGPRLRKLSKEEIETLVKNGRSSMYNYLLQL